MFTVCTHCHRQFRIRAKQLSAANGQVKCGYCGQQFNALQQLSDKPHDVKSSPASVITKASSQHSKVNASWSPVREGHEQATDVNNVDIPKENPAHVSQGAGRETVSYPFSGSSESFVQADINRPLKAFPENTIAEIATAKREKAIAAGKQQSEYYFPESMILNEPEKQKRILSIIIWTLGCFLLMLTFASQLAWFYRDDVLRFYPQLKPYVTHMCEMFNCQVQRVEAVNAFRLLNRDVRLHPSYQDALLVNATIANQSNRITPYPLIQLTLFDTVGQIISYRLFEPKEYLDQSMNEKQGLLPEQSVHFALELTGELDQAVSFEFDFF